MSHLKCFSLEKHVGVCRKEDTLNHATSYEILCEKKKPRLEVKISHLKSPVRKYGNNLKTALPQKQIGISYRDN
jgi:hypothetical protein